MDSFRLAIGLFIAACMVLILSSVVGLLSVDLPTMPDLAPQVQYRRSVYRYFTLEEYREGNALVPIALRIDLDAYPDYIGACDSVIPDDNGHDCYSEDQLLIAVFLDRHHIGQ